LVYPGLQLVQVNVSDLLRLNAKVVQSLPLRGVVEAYHEGGNVGAETHPLMVAPRLTQGVGAVVSLEAHRARPAFYQAVQVANGQGLSGPQREYPGPGKA
jgi:hypothetical protein